MANINPSSVRDELDRLKHEFNRLSKEDAIPSETKLLMQSMFTLLELIFAIFLEKKDTQNEQEFQQVLGPEAQRNEKLL